MPAMHLRLTVFCLFLGSSILACTCERNESRKRVAAPPSPIRPMGMTPSRQMPQAPPAPARPALLSPSEAKKLLTEKKIAGFMTYRKEMSSVTGDAAGMGISAHQKAGTDQAALAKSGLTQEEVSKLNQVLGPYYARVYTMDRLFGRSGGATGEESKGEPPPGSMEAAKLKAREVQKEQLKAVRKEFADRYGAEVLELVRKHEADFVAISEKPAGGGMGAMGTKK